MQPSRTSHDRISPLKQFSGRKLDASRDLRIDFGEYVHATVPDPDSTFASRTQGCIALLSSGNSTGSVTMWFLATNRTVKRDQHPKHPKLPTPDLVIAHINSIATSEGYFRGSEPDIGPLESDPRDLEELSPLPTMMALPDSAGVVHLADSILTFSDEGMNRPAEMTMEVDTSSAAATTASATHTADAMEDNVTAGTNQESTNEMSSAATTLLELAGMRINQTQSTPTAAAGDNETAMIMTVKAALRDRPIEATSVMKDELRQMRIKKVWHGVKREDLSMQQYRAIIRSSMFLKDKYLASGTFEKFKVRLVAGGNQQDKSLYENLSSPTAALTSVFTTVGIAAHEGRERVVIDIGGAFLHADMAPTGIDVHMRLNKVMTQMLVEIDGSNKEFVDRDGSMIVRLDKALYGCVEASNLWYNDLRDKLTANGLNQTHTIVVYSIKLGKAVLRRR